MGLWERFIASGLFGHYDNWTKENMEQFHKDTLNRLLPPKEVGLGYKSIVENSDNTHHSHLHQVIKIYLDELSILEMLCDKFYFYWKDSEKSIALLEKERVKYETKIKLLEEKQKFKGD